MAAKQIVDAFVNSGSKVTIISKSYCPFCVRAKELFQKINQPFEVLELDTDDEKVAYNGVVSTTSDIQDYLRSVTGIRSVPQVFIKGQFIGGCDDTHAKHKSGQLAALLA